MQLIKGLGLVILAVVAIRIGNSTNRTQSKNRGGGGNNQGITTDKDRGVLNASERGGGGYGRLFKIHY